ncbi:uncharacterized protein M8220_006905 [Acridotheres tristis]
MVWSLKWMFALNFIILTTGDNRARDNSISTKDIPANPEAFSVDAGWRGPSPPTREPANTSILPLPALYQPWAVGSGLLEKDEAIKTIKQTGLAVPSKRLRSCDAAQENYRASLRDDFNQLYL